MTEQQPKRMKPLTAKQAQVMKIIRAGGLLYLNPTCQKKYRLLDRDMNPVILIQQRTFQALANSGRIVRGQNTTWIRKPLKSKKYGVTKV